VALTFQGGFDLSQRIRVLGAVLALLCLMIVLSACGSPQVAQNWPGLTLAGDTIYVISGLPQRVYMLDAETGGQKGTFVPRGEVKGTPYWSPVAVGGGLAYVGFADPQGGNAGLHAFDPETGQEQWQVPAKSFIIPAPLYADGVVYFGSSDGLVYAVDVEAKRVKPGWPFQAEEAIWATPLLVEERLYVAAQDHHLYCLDAESGEEIWRQKVGGAMAAQPVLDAASGILYVGAFDGKLYAIKADSGELVEGFDFKADNWLWSEVLLEDDLLYVTSLDGRLYALDPSSGAKIQPYPYETGDVIRAAPVRAKDFVVVATQDGRVIATENALMQWGWPGGTSEIGVLTTPVVSGDTVYVVLMDGKVQALDAENGAQGWTFVPPESD
jgi:outer membrane protein assembly factor BamB